LIKLIDKKLGMKNPKWLSEVPPGRLLSLDIYRGFAMLFLIAETTGLYDLMISPSLQGTLIHTVGKQFQHHPWHGLTLWDMGQSFFMFISGVAMAFPMAKGSSAEMTGNIASSMQQSGPWPFISWAGHFTL